MRRTLSRTLSLLLIVLALGACGGDDSASGDERSDADAEAPAMFDFVADAVGGGEVVGIDYAGRDVVVWFWAPWCTSCNREAPDMVDLVAERGDEVAFLGMTGLADVSDMEDFVERHGLSDIPHAIDTDGSIWQKFGVTSQSVFVFVNDDGSATKTEFGVQGPAALNAAIDDLLAS